MLADSLILNLEFVKLAQKELLPSYSAIYYVIDESKQILYIGQSINLNRRWNGEQPHHRYEQLCSLEGKTHKQIYLYYEKVDKSNLLAVEKNQILKYQPLLNNTPVQKYFNGEVNQKQKYIATNSDRAFSINSISAILSDFKLLSDKNKHQKELQPNLFVDNMNQDTKSETQPVANVETNRHQVNRFTRKFVTLKSSKIDLLLELEICIDPKERLFVRHHILSYIQTNNIQPIDSTNIEQTSKQYISNLENQLIRLRNPVRWIGYKLNCEQILLVDEEDELEIETLAIMLPLRMFVNLLENDWLKNSSLPELLEKEEDQRWKTHNLFIKIAKYLHDENTTLVNLIVQLD